MKMAERDFPVVFYDGEREINMGNVRVKSSLNFKSFQLGLSQRIGISPNQITVYLVHRFPDPRRKIPITNKTDFSLLSRETECHFLVVLKRTRRHRRISPALAMEKTILLQQNETGFAERMRELQIRRENYVAQMNLASDPQFFPAFFPTVCESYLAVMCRECDEARRQWKAAEFHLCVCDAIVVGFRTRAGPIAPPHKHASEQ